MSINKTFLSGNLTRDAELKQAQSGTSILEFGIAVNERRKNQSGDWEDYPNFFDCTMFGKRAEALHERLTRGAKVSIEGRLHYHSWTAQDGSKRSRITVTVDEIELFSSKICEKNDEKNSEIYRKNRSQTQAVSAFADDDIPF